MSPFEAWTIELEEPDWKERFMQYFASLEASTVAQRLSTPAQVRFAAEDTAFEATLKDWRRWHKDDQDKPADASTGMVALSILGIYPPRSLIKDVPRGGGCYQEQHDDHMWLIMSQRAWRIVAIEDRTMILDSFGDQTQVDLTRAKWGKYLEKAIEALNTHK